jgi:hypothetical protein
LLLKALELDIGGYLNDTDFQDPFFGGQYGDLLRIKKLDPSGLFITCPRVGREGRIKDGQCRVY